MKKLHKLLMTTTAIVSIFVWNIHSTPVAAKQKSYKCESYKTINGQWRYRISPELQGSFGKAPNSPSLMSCFIPVSNKKCRYNHNTGDGWLECGKCKKSPSDPFNFCLGEGYGEIIEVPNGSRYRAFMTETSIVLD